MSETNVRTRNSFTNTERELIFGMVEDYTLFGLPAVEIKRILDSRLKYPISFKTVQNMKLKILKQRKSSDTWLEDFTKAQIADHYRERIDRMKYLEQKLLTIFDEEFRKEKPSSQNIAMLARAIIETDKTLADYGLAPPILSKIKQLIPLNITDYNPKIEQKAINLINQYDDHAKTKPESEPTIGISEYPQEEDDNAVF